MPAKFEILDNIREVETIAAGQGGTSAAGWTAYMAEAAGGKG